MVVDDGFVFMSHVLSNTLWVAPKTGGAITDLATVPIGSLAGRMLAQGGEDVYSFGDTASQIQLYEFAKSGAPPTLVHDGPGSGSIDPGAIVVEQDFVYFTAAANGGGVSYAYSWDRTAKVTTQLYTAGVTMAGNSSHLYWRQNGSFWRATKTQGAVPQQLAPALGNIEGIAVNETLLAYSHDESLEVAVMSLQAPFSTTTLNPNATFADYLSLPIMDDMHVYLMTGSYTQSNNKIYRVSLAGGPEEVFVDEQVAGRGMAQDATHIYWAVASDCGPSCAGQIVRKAK